jgi:hypothetical protein
MESVFGSVDKNRDNKIASEWPAWMQERNVDNLKEEINQIEVGIRSGRFNPDEVHEARQDKANKEAKLEAIMKSKPNPDVAEKDMLYKYYRSFGAKISESMFTRSDMNYGLAPAHEEAKRMKLPCITLDPNECEIALSCNVTPNKKRMVSRDQASKVFKLLGKILDEPANVEHLRQDKKTENVMVREVAAPKPVAPEHLEGTSQAPTTKSGKPDKRFKG